MIRTLIVLTLSAFPATLHAAPLHVVATGDSLTRGYFPFFQGELDARQPGRFATSMVAIGGTDAREYAGLEVNSQCGCGLTDMVADVLALNPDVIVFMLGTNDSSFATGPDHFAALVPTFLNAFAGATVIIGSPPPILPTDPFHAAASTRLDNSVDPLIRQMAADRGLPLVDLRAFDWTGLYIDAVHFSHPEGRQVMAGIFADAVATVPEPGALHLLLLSLCWATLRRQRNMRRVA